VRFLRAVRLTQAISLFVAALLIVLVILPTQQSPATVIGTMLSGAFGSWEMVARAATTLAPVLLCAAGLAFTFSAGLYNLGVEGQVLAGAVATTALVRVLFPDGGEALAPPVVIMALGIVAGFLGGMLWGLLAGLLHVYGRISEIFAGLGLNFVAQGMAIFLIFGPWKRAGVASMSGTALFDESVWLPVIGVTELSPAALVLAGVALIVTLVVLRNTVFGLRLRAVGHSLRSSFILGIPATQHMLSAFAICGAFAGLAGATQALAVFHRLIPGISSNLGYLGLLVAMLANYNPIWLLPIAAFFSALNIGALKLPSELKVESSLAGVIQGILVLAVLLGRGLPNWPAARALDRKVRAKLGLDDDAAA
jgi:simple sugar transport system permease protein